MDDYGHWPECETCTRAFRTQRARNQHMNDRGHWAPRFECETCDREFFSQNAANQHMNDRGHWKPKVPCETCSRKFHTQNAANQHMDALDHWAPQFPCEKCNLVFWSEAAADRHMEEKGHFRNYCAPCNRRFQNENNLQMVGVSFVGTYLQMLTSFPSIYAPRLISANPSTAHSARLTSRLQVGSPTTLKRAPAPTLDPSIVIQSIK